MTAVAFAHELSCRDLPDDVTEQARRCLLDLSGVAVAGSTTELARIIRDHAARHFAAGQIRSSLLLDGREVSPPGAALAGGMMIDSVDAHDGHRLTKGHAGCGSLPAALALIEAHDVDDSGELLALMVLGYELGTRAGIALHGTAEDYHTSGAWIAVACSAMGARVMGLDTERTRHAIGIAEYHGPRSQMMRVVDHPTMLKDGSGWGAMAGLSAAYLAADGFTGAPALTVEADDVAHLWSDLGSKWHIMDQYFKAYPVCRWGQPAVTAALELINRHGVNASDVDHIEIATFHEARRLAVTVPTTTDEAQYSLPWPVAAATVRGTVGVDEISESALKDPQIVRLSKATTVVETDEFNAAFPARRFAQVTLFLTDGRALESNATEAIGDPEIPLSGEDLALKFRHLTEPVLGGARSRDLLDAGTALDAGRSVKPYLDLLREPA